MSPSAIWQGQSFSDHPAPKLAELLCSSLAKLLHFVFLWLEYWVLTISKLHSAHEKPILGLVMELKALGSEFCTTKPNTMNTPHTVQLVVLSWEAEAGLPWVQGQLGHRLSSRTSRASVKLAQKDKEFKIPIWGSPWQQCPSLYYVHPDLYYVQLNNSFNFRLVL